MVSFAFSISIISITWWYVTRGRVHSGDTFFHLLISQHIREHNGKYPSSLENVTFLEGEKRYNYLAYPPLLHYITAILPVKHQLNMTKVVNIIIMSILGSLAGVFTYALTANSAFILLSIFATTFSLSACELVTMWTPRPLGLLFYSLLLLGSVFFPFNLISISVLAILITCTILSHKFALQSLVFGLVPFSLIFGKAYLLLAFVLGFLLSILITKGSYLQVFKEHISWLYFYFKHPPKQSTTKKLTRILSTNLWALPLFVLVLIVFSQNSHFFEINKPLSEIIYWALVPNIIAVVISIPKLTFLGEEYRYVEYGILPVGIALSVILLTQNPLTWLTLPLTLACTLLSGFAILKYKQYLKDSKALVCSNDISSYRDLSNYGFGNLLVIPHTRGLEVRYFTKLHLIHQVRKASLFKSDFEYFNDLLSGGQIKNVLRFKDNDPWQLFSRLSNYRTLKIVLAYQNFELYEITEKK